MKNWSNIWILACVVILTIGCINNLPQENKIVKGSYLGQKEPGDSARLFAPGFISNGLNNRDFII